MAKLRRLGLTNRIVDDMDFKQSEFEKRNSSNSKSDVKIEFQLKDNVEF